MPCDDLEGWGGVGEAQEEGGINRYIIMTDSCWCIETTSLQSNYAPIHFFFFSLKPAKGREGLGVWD